MSGAVSRVGRPAYEPQPEQRVLVERLIGMTVPEKTIASTFINPPISHKTLRKSSGRKSSRAATCCVAGCGH